ncbi:TetR/AcrR family transcriptional regulator [Thermomonospora umbrina]|uniref:TetR family transcriptional regulator n=1 Tax=Thermomonospora umbrina TaxID=111806 RepID=A0A3D9T5M9_9ACTN|nr:TetR/AcrR family transcriptional regulator C-terminal domain-containing protein [Thermomonospora umbrina]REF00015.1 TetR family transcriptional regulator [Thermomonospora umbrina]
MGRPPRRLLDRETIVRAGLDLVDAHGADALSVNRVAAELGVKGPSLYNYISGRDDLVDGIRELIVAEMELDLTVTPWTATLDAWARSYRAAFGAHPKAVPLLVARPIRSPGALRAYAVAFAGLREAGWPEHRVLPVVWAVECFLLGAALTAGPPVVAAAPDDPPPGVEALFDAGPKEFDAAFETGLAALIRGLAFELDGLLR